MPLFLLEFELRPLKRLMTTGLVIVSLFQVIRMSSYYCFYNILLCFNSMSFIVDVHVCDAFLIKLDKALLKIFIFETLNSNTHCFMIVSE